ncbi:unnamed protein product, partial [Amoebophrya sp. A120]|eukprot:GSA120T00015484001.1
MRRRRDHLKHSDGKLRWDWKWKKESDGKWYSERTVYRYLSKMYERDYLKDDEDGGKRQLKSMTVNGEPNQDTIGKVSHADGAATLVMFNLPRAKQITQLFIVSNHRQSYQTICGLEFFRFTSVAEEIDPSIWKASNFPSSDDYDFYGLTKNNEEHDSKFKSPRRRSGEPQWDARVQLPLYYARGRSTKWPNYCTHTEKILQTCDWDWRKQRNDQHTFMHTGALRLEAKDCPAATDAGVQPVGTTDAWNNKC